ncbi:PTS transporter subunit EIIC [Vagococcus fluvialis]|uniref:PTS transporter subunit EIIC n=1 Tax=Vagococcus fluvialis TaxID=2738 RepID=UPI003D0DB2D5
MKNESQQLGEKIIELSGGKTNFKTVKNCMTRVRITYNDLEKVKKEEIENLDGVLGVNVADTFQIIVGPGKSVKVQEAINEILGASTGSEEEPPEEKNFLKMLSNIFVPLIPAIIASGFLQGINNILVSNAKVSAMSQNIATTDALAPFQVILQQDGLLKLSTLLGILGDATFAFLAIYVGMTAAKQFKTDPILGAALGAATTLPSLSLLGLTPGQGGLFGIIFGIWLMSKVNVLLKKIIPDVLDVVLTPTFNLIITGTIYIFLIMPVAGKLSDWLIGGIMFLLENTGVFGGFVLATAFPSLIATGLHHGLSPIHMELINSTGGTPIFPVQIMSNAGLLGAGIAILFLTKNQKTKDIAKGCLPTTFLAVGEPTMYGLVIPSGFGFITASLGAGVAGALVRFFDIKSSAFGAAGMSATPLMADGKYIQYLICYAVGVVSAFILTVTYAKVRNRQI